MSKPVAVAWRETEGELCERYRTERAVGRRKRLQVLWRVRAGDAPAVAGEAAGVGLRTVERWLGWQTRPELWVHIASLSLRNGTADSA